MAHDALFVQLAGGQVPSVDILYDDLERFGETEIASLEALMAAKALERLRRAKPTHHWFHLWRPEFFVADAC